MLSKLKILKNNIDESKYSVKYIDLNDSKIATREVKKTIAELLEQLVDHHYSIMGNTFDLLGIPEMFRDTDWAWYKKNSYIYCLYDGDTIIGVCTTRTYKTGRRAKNTCYIMELLLEKSYRGQELGKFLLDSTVKDCKKREPYINIVMLDVYDKNGESMQTYLNNGFTAFSHALYKKI